MLLCLTDALVIFLNFQLPLAAYAPPGHLVHGVNVMLEKMYYQFLCFHHPEVFFLAWLLPVSTTKYFKEIFSYSLVAHDCCLHCAMPVCNCVWICDSHRLARQSLTYISYVVTTPQDGSGIIKQVIALARQKAVVLASIWKDRNIKTATKVKVMKSMVWAVFQCGVEG